MNKAMDSSISAEVSKADEHSGESLDNISESSQQSKLENKSSVHDKADMVAMIIVHGALIFVGVLLIFRRVVGEVAGVFDVEVLGGFLSLGASLLCGI